MNRMGDKYFMDDVDLEKELNSSPDFSNSNYFRNSNRRIVKPSKSHTTNKGRPKMTRSKRKMVKESRRRNRSK